MHGQTLKFLGEGLILAPISSNLFFGTFVSCPAFVVQRSYCFKRIDQVMYLYTFFTCNWFWWKLAPKISGAFSTRLIFEIALR